MITYETGGTKECKRVIHHCKYWQRQEILPARIEGDEMGWWIIEHLIPIIFCPFCGSELEEIK